MPAGQVIGATDRIAGEAVSRPVSFGALYATLYRNLGIDVNRIFALTFAIGSGLAGLGGALAINMVGLDPNFATKYLIYVLLVVSVNNT